MSKELDIVPVLSRQLTTTTSTEAGNNSKLNEKGLVDDEKGLGESDSVESTPQDFPWRWKATALVLGVFLSGKLRLPRWPFVNSRESNLKANANTS